MNYPGRKDPSHSPSLHMAKVLACAFGLWTFGAVHAQQADPASTPAPAPMHPQVQAPQPGASGTARPAMKVASGSKGATKVAVVTKPLWRELTPMQQQSLAPLATKWDTLNETQKRKWIALSQNFPRMPVAEQAKLHSRMTEWASLSAQQRAQARISFGETQAIPPDDKKAKWEAYQALSPEEKKKLAAGATKPPTTAAAIKPVAPDKLAHVPTNRPRSKSEPEAKAPRIAAAPNQVDHNTLLPQQQPASAPAPASN